MTENVLINKPKGEANGKDMFERMSVNLDNPVHLFKITLGIIVLICGVFGFALEIWSLFFGGRPNWLEMFFYLFILLDLVACVFVMYCVFLVHCSFQKISSMRAATEKRNI